MKDLRDLVAVPADRENDAVAFTIVAQATTETPNVLVYLRVSHVTLRPLRPSMGSQNVSGACLTAAFPEQSQQVKLLPR